MREAILHVSPSELAALGIPKVVDHLMSAGHFQLSELVTDGSGGLHYVVVEEPIPETVLDEAPSLEWWVRLKTDTEAAVYVWKVQSPSESTASALHSAGQEGTAESDTEMEISVIGPGRSLEESATLSNVIERRNSDAYLDRLTTPRRVSTPLASLTDRQREVLRLAFEMGYYEVPRIASSEDIADRVSLDPSTVAEHLQRAERNLLEAVFG